MTALHATLHPPAFASRRRDGSRERCDGIAVLLHRVAGSSYPDIHAAIDRLSREHRDALNALATEILDDARTIAASP